ncbi:hypothetical protein QTJ16_000345 [Diplocarpon rosae]|uniref:Uncharacterized protein n=1 Tax=Diplocarpon rosae TaxID=946125 RepID=A0AAD9T729_9HELO|nr:hypothetical protein QTJ16_000345 [Diplocarpon rosae]PBP28497.1 hypothetical protein BUE80_DR000462 [Diplocarpon rosae]
MFDADCIYEGMEDIPCPVARQVKAKGWGKIQEWCGPECHFCCLLESNHLDEESGNLRHGFLIWPATREGSILDVAEAKYRSSCPPFNIESLPRDLQQYLLRFMLVAVEPITNPFISRGKQKIPAGETIQVRHTWSKYMRPGLLATNKRFYRCGMSMLYGYNTFRFTRLVEDLPVKGIWTCQLSGPLEAKADAFDRFLSFQHQRILSPEKRNVNRSLLLRNIILTDSDLDCDEYSRKGIARLCSVKPCVDKLRYVFWYISKLARYGVHLHNLIITVDEEEPMTAQTIAYESGRIMLHKADEATVTKWKKADKLQKSLTDTWTTTWEQRRWKDVGMEIASIQVRGTDIFAGGGVRFAVADEWSTKTLESHCLPTSRVAKGLVEYFQSNHRIRQLRNHPIISFSGRFTERRLREDGTVVAVDKVDEWLQELAEAEIAQAEKELAEEQAMREMMTPTVVPVPA